MPREQTVRRGPATRPVRRVAARTEDPGLEMKRADIELFLSEWEAKGCVADTLEHYRNILERL